MRVIPLLITVALIILIVALLFIFVPSASGLDLVSTPTLWDGTQYPTVTHGITASPTYYFYTATPPPYPEPIEATPWNPYPYPPDYSNASILELIVNFFRGFFLRAK